jgi:hypothetical protein
MYIEVGAMIESVVLYDTMGGRKVRELVRIIFSPGWKQEAVTLVG